MNCKKNKLKANCGSYIFAQCTKYEGEVSESSELTTGCLNIEETTQDIYNQLDDIDEKLDMSVMTNDCIIFTEPKTPSSVIKQLYDKICALEDIITSQAAQITTMQNQITELQQSEC